MKYYPLLFVVLLSILAFPPAASANAGTPLMWAGALHLLFGNALIGLGEGLLLGWLFAAPKGKAILFMILANYASAWLGGVFLANAIAHALPMDLNNGWRWLWVMVGATYCITLLMEWPFVAWCFRGKRDWLTRSLQGSLVVQSASYVVLFGWYWMASGTSLYTEMNIVAPADLSLPESVLVYYISPSDGDAYRRQLPSGEPEKVCELHSTGRNDRLFVRPSTPNANQWDLVARLETQDYRNPQIVVVKSNMPVGAAPDRLGTERDYEGTWFNFGEVQKLGDAANSDWEFRTGFWPVEGLWGSKKTAGERVGFSYETPFGAWSVRNAVQLPLDEVLFQLGHDQICAFDPGNKRVALLWRGRGPVPVIDKTPIGANGTEAGHREHDRSSAATTRP